MSSEIFSNFFFCLIQLKGILYFLMKIGNVVFIVRLFLLE